MLHFIRGGEKKTRCYLKEPGGGGEKKWGKDKHDLGKGG